MIKIIIIIISFRQLLGATLAKFVSKRNNVLNPDMMKKLESNTWFHQLTPKAKLEKENKKTTLQRENPLSLNR
jgi:hypothetical protein